MKFLFIDETQDQHNKEYLGICISVMDSSFYYKIYKLTKKILEKYGWDRNTELKGSYIYSISKGCKDVDIERRISLIKELLSENVANTNSRIKFGFIRTKSKNVKGDYLISLPILIGKILKKANSGAGKNLISIFFDERNDLKETEISEAIKQILIKRGYLLVESVSRVKSSNDSIGIMYTDLVGYLIGRIHNLKEADELNNKTNNYNQIKFQTSKELIKIVKDLKRYILE